MVGSVPGLVFALTLHRRFLRSRSRVRPDMPATSPRHLLLRPSKHARMTCVDIATQANLDGEAGLLAGSSGTGPICIS